ncbi:MAG: hypothetical protein LQ338_003448 [Usnochroma carphineum]|nr:MAG: hypothetical protein LQ338_003448 [Usnochroma carphineum]
MPSPTAQFIGQSGHRYLIDRVLQDKGPPFGRVCLATADNQKFVLKDIPADFEYYEKMYRNLCGCPYLRPLQDIIPDQSIFVFDYYTDHLLNVVQKDLPDAVIKRILHDALCGLATLHDHNIVHTDIKPNNILVEIVEDHHGIDVAQVKLTDIEDAAYVPVNCAIVGRQVGNWMWRSPEAHAEGQVNKPSDMFSFAIVCIYAMQRRIIFFVDEKELEEGEHILSHVLERQISYFADLDGLDALFKHLGDSPWCDIFRTLRDGFNAENPRKPVALWQGIDAEFKDLIIGLTNFNPAKRLTAQIITSKAITTVERGAKTLSIHYVTETSAWKRPEGLLSEEVKKDFALIAERNVHTYKKKTRRIAMKESAHTSDNNMRRHYSAYEINDSGEVIGMHHILKDVASDTLEDRAVEGEDDVDKEKKDK